MQSRVHSWTEPQPEPPRTYQLTLTMNAEEVKHLYNICCMNVSIPKYYEDPDYQRSYGITYQSMHGFLRDLSNALAPLNVSRTGGPRP